MAIFVQVARDAHRVDFALACENERTLERGAQLRAALRAKCRIVSAECRLEMDVSDVQNAVLQDSPFMRRARATRDVIRAG
jgi:hypothetical protein